MTSHLSVRETATALGITITDVRNYMKQRLLEYTKDVSGRVLLNIEDARWALYWYQRLQEQLPEYAPNERKNVSRAFVIELRDHIRGIGSRFYHDFQNEIDRKKPLEIREYFYAGTKGVLMGVGAAFLVMSLFRFLLPIL